MIKSIFQLDKNTFDNFIKGETATPITFAELMLLLVQQDGGRYRSFIIATATQAKMNKGCIKRASKNSEGVYTNDFHDTYVDKITICIGNMNLQYEKLVNQKRVSLGLLPTFVSQENWHKNTLDEKNGSIVHNQINENSKRYLKFNSTRANRLGFKVNNTWCNEAEIEMIKAHLVKSASPTNQGLPAGEEIIIRTVTLNNILMIKFNGTLYKITDRD